MNKITPIDRKNAYVGKLFRKQITQIYEQGCNGLKCSDCCMTKICDHFPEHSRTLAYNLLMYAAKKVQIEKQHDIENSTVMQNS
jgi:hypothetical protein